MPKVIDDLTWIRMVLEKHQPHIIDIGDQRDPEPIVTCLCQRGIYPRDKSFPPYSDHVLDLIQEEIPNIFGPPPFVPPIPSGIRQGYVVDGELGP